MIIFDSSFLIGFLNTSDKHHDRSTKLMRNFVDGDYGDGLLLEYVFLEVVTVLSLRLDAKTATATGQTLLNSRQLSLVPCSDLFEESFRAFMDLASRGLSFVDCALVVAARTYDAPIMTFDKDLSAISDVEVLPN